MCAHVRCMYRVVYVMYMYVHHSTYIHSSSSYTIEIFSISSIRNLFSYSIPVQYIYITFALKTKKEKKKNIVAHLTLTAYSCVCVLRNTTHYTHVYVRTYYTPPATSTCT